LFANNNRNGGPLASLSKLLLPFQGERLVEWFSDLTELWHDTAPIKPMDISSPKGLTQWVHYKNFIVWHLEEQVRHRETADQDIIQAEKTIDEHNTKRLAAIEQIDIWIDNVLQSADVNTSEDAEINSETPGSIVDRLSILGLKLYHMQEHLSAAGLDENYRKIVTLQMHILQEQRDDLAKALDQLLLDIRQGKKRHKVYRQFKIYNDPSFHPKDYDQ
jgi:hypothetical protein